MRSNFLSIVALTLFLLVSDSRSQDLPHQLGPQRIKRIAAGTPMALPQQPVMKRPTTDAQDTGIKGSVKRVIEEEEFFDDDGKTQGRKFRAIRDYDSAGYLVRSIPFDSKGEPYEVTVYGYIDGMRVTRSKDVPGAEILTGAMSAGDQALFEATRKPDTRFDSEYRYKYENGQLIEKHMFYRDGSAGMRYTYRRTGNEFEELAYGYDRKLNQKYVSKLDERGNEAELLDVAVINQQWRGDRKYKFKYESFDNHGNWTKRVKSRVLTEDGKEVHKPWYATYRTITYHAK